MFRITVVLIALVGILACTGQTPTSTLPQGPPPSPGPIGLTPVLSTLTPVAVVSTEVDVSVEKTVSDASPAAGDTISYNIVVSNLSVNPATGIVVTDLLPAPA